MIREILLYGTAPLGEKADDVPEMTDEVRRELDDMKDTMNAASCIGLSAPQIGIKKRLFVVSAGGVKIAGANPEIIKAGAMTEDTEGSPCIPGISAKVRRPGKISCRYLDYSGDIAETELKGLPARVFQHEMDYHDGKLFIDLLKPFQRKLLQKDLDRIKEKNKN